MVRELDRQLPQRAARRSRAQIPEEVNLGTQGTGQIVEMIERIAQSALDETDFAAADESQILPAGKACRQAISAGIVGRGDAEDEEV